MADGLLNKASIILTPTGYKAGTLYNVAPVVEPYEDFDFARTSTATRINSSGLVSNVATGVPRISYDSNGDNNHILLEPTTTNLYLNTDTLSTQNVSTSASDYSVSFYGTGTITFSGSYSGSLVGTGVNDRVSLTFTATSGTLTSTVSGSVTNAQIENLGYSTSYMPSLSTQGVRATETATGAGSADLINSTEGVLYAEIAALDDGISQQIGVYGNSTSKQLRIEIANSVIRAQLFNGAYQANMSSTQTVTNFNKIAFKWKVNDFALWINGTEVATDSSGSTFPANDLDRLNLSGQNGIASLAQAKIKSLAVFNEALSDSELTQLTT